MTKSVLALLKLEIKLSYGNSFKKIKRNFFSFFTFLITAVILFLIAFLVLKILNGLILPGNKIGIVSMLISCIQIILLFYAAGNQMNLIFGSKDKILLARLPVSFKEIFLSKALMNLINLYIINVALTLPLLIMQGVIANYAAGFFFSIIFIVLLNPLIPFGVALIIAIPAIYIKSVLANKFLINLMFFIAFIAGAFVLYSKGIFALSNYLFSGAQMSESVLTFITINFSSNFLSSTWFANLLLNSNYILNLLLVALFSAVAVAAGCVVGFLVYKNIFIQSLQNNYHAKVIKTRSKQQGAFKALFKKELKDIYRSNTYAFSYLGLAFATPIMVFVCNNFIVSFAKEMVGSVVTFGVTLLIVLMFLSIICSMSASFVSREGDQFWFSKINPEGVKINLMSKALVCTLISFVALLISFVVIVAFKFVKLTDSLIIFAIGIIYIFGLISCGLNINVRKPNLFKRGIENNTNIIITMLIGTFISCVVGLLAIVLAFAHSFVFMLPIILCIVLVFSLINLAVFFITCEKKYVRIEN